MSEEITITVGDLHADLHEEMAELLGDEYNENMRNRLENIIHETYQQVERMQDEQAAVEVDE